ncbi:MAG: hypothetical protein CL676_10610 [Bdellovibrionaceae bacterium]|nr:hypothetical protein [Pseudobdellovibrionaceae bacterium]|tara:strand:- start:902 stop:1162 length:261 start_codon:yes stop_codon:yes gene_type:complete
MVGTELIPLNQMDKASDLYTQHSAKYVGRDQLLEASLPLLNCKWNDVVQFSALDPQKIADELKKIKPALKIFRKHYFRVPVSQIIG